MVEGIVIGVVAAVGLLVGAAAGGRAQKRRQAALLESARRQAQRISQEAQRSVDLTRREGEALAREEVLQIERVAAAEQEAVVEQIERLKVRVDVGRQRLGGHDEQLQERQTKLDSRFKELRLQRDAVKTVREETKALKASVRSVLEKRAEQQAEDLARQMADTLIESSRSQGADLLRNLESNGNEDFIRAAKRVMGISIARYTGHCPRDRGMSTFALAAGQADKLTTDLSAWLAQMVEELGVNVTISESGESARLETGDGVGRELARRGLTRMLGERRVKDPDHLIANLRGELEREILDLGQRAFRQLHLEPAHPEILDLVGRLNWRTSYTQNQYRHAIEAANLAGLMARELNLDGMLARRGGLLHDIGKALSHAVDGSHALNGAAIARRVGEHELVANAIAAHHGEEPMASAYAWLAAAADAMSGGRPGARREIVESYGDRIGDIERIANSFRGVAAVHAMQAGRELRVFVDERRVGEQQLEDMSAEIAERISDELTFPGQIRVTVIREFRAVATAN